MLTDNRCDKRTDVQESNMFDGTSSEHSSEDRTSEGERYEADGFDISERWGNDLPREPMVPAPRDNKEREGRRNYDPAE